MEALEPVLAVVIIAPVLVALAKGRFFLFVFSFLIPFVILWAWVAGFRLARPSSPWALLFYGEGKRYPVKYIQSVKRFDGERFEREGLKEKIPAGYVLDHGAVVKVADAQKMGPATEGEGSTETPNVP